MALVVCMLGCQKTCKMESSLFFPNIPFHNVFVWCAYYSACLSHPKIGTNICVNYHLLNNMVHVIKVCKIKVHA